MDSLGWETLFTQEIERAQAARLAGNEGQARVCARRAAGHAIREYLRRSGNPQPGASVTHLLETLGGLPGLSPQARTIADHLLLRVNTDFALPESIDLIAEALDLVRELGMEAKLFRSGE